jgi:hypothetical protein
MMTVTINNIFFKQMPRFVFLALFLVSCASRSKLNEGVAQDTNSDNSLENGSTENTIPSNPNDVLLNMTIVQAKQYAQQQQVPFRVIKEDGIAYLITEDYVPGRINATVVANKIIHYFIEGNTADLIKNKPDNFIGKTVKEAQDYAKKQGLLFRIVVLDGAAQMVTRDYRPGRINATVVNGIVTKYAVE